MAKKVLQLTPLADEARSALPTGEMARHLSREPATLYQWNHYGTYPACLKPVKDGRGRLSWPVQGAIQFLRGEVAQ